jgi:hypothetical protein
MGLTQLSSYSTGFASSSSSSSSSSSCGKLQGNSSPTYNNRYLSSFLASGTSTSSTSGGGGGGGGGGKKLYTSSISEGNEAMMYDDVSKSGKIGPSSYFDAGDYGDQENMAKLGGLAREYEQLLTTQLGEQRRYYEQLLGKEVARIAAENELVDEKALDEEKIAITQVKDSIEALEVELRNGMEQLRHAEAKLRTARKEQGLDCCYYLFYLFIFYKEVEEEEEEEEEIYICFKTSKK